MATAFADPKSTDVTAPQQEFSFWRQFWRRFRRNKAAVGGALILVLLFLSAIFAWKLAPLDPNNIVLADRLKPPGYVSPTLHVKYVLGTDGTGRDLLSRLLYGGRISMSIGFLTAFLSLAVGITVGAVSGFYGGAIDNALMRLTEFMMVIPRLPITLIVLAVFGNSFFLLLFVIGLTSWMGVARLVRAEFLSLRERDFVEAARAQGARDNRIIYRHILPNAMAPLIVNATFQVAGAILLEATLSFLGLGVQAPTPSWGNMLISAQSELAFGVWWTSVIPGLMIVLAVLSFNLVGDGLRDALDPKLKQ
ncbi:MAG: ABC transporter permease [Mycobacterium leprae]